MKYNFFKIPIITAILFLGFSCFAFLFLYGKIKNNNEISAQMFDEWKAEEQKRQDLKFLDDSVRSIEVESSLFNNHFIQSSNIVPFLDMIESLGPNAGAKTQVLFVDDASDPLVVDIKSSGSFESIYKFITLLENSPYEMEFVSIDMNKAAFEGAPKTVGWTAILKVKLLSFIK